MNITEIKEKIKEIEDYVSTSYSMIEDIEDSLKHIRDNLQNITNMCSDLGYEMEEERK